MDLQSLTLLVEIIDSGNLSQAARKLKMTRANVSYHLSQLEKSVGVQLVKRTTRRVEPTEVGLRLYEHGRNIHNEMLAARETITSLGQELRGRVGISVPSGYGQIVVSDWLIEFKRLYPGIESIVRRWKALEVSYTALPMNVTCRQVATNLDAAAETAEKARKALIDAKIPARVVEDFGVRPKRVMVVR
jgi:DNA-binding transcriptional LysR family regulator